jgi:uncharacterized protein (UPF0276 family)
MVKLNLVYDLLQTTKISSSSSTVDVERKKHTDQIYFVICNSCYWCATYFRFDPSLSSSSSSSPLACHGCSLRNTELIPISTDESFRIKYNPTRGIEVEFYR